MTIEFPTTIQISFHKFTLTLFLQVLKFLSFNGINYKSHAKVLRTFKGCLENEENKENEENEENEEKEEKGKTRKTCNYELLQ